MISACLVDQAAQPVIGFVERKGLIEQIDYPDLAPARQVMGGGHGQQQWFAHFTEHLKVRIAWPA